MKDNLYLGDEARNGLMNGIRKAAHAVAITLGTAGKNSLIETMASPGSYPTNDGFSIVNAIRLADPLEEMGRGKLCEAINRTNRQNGDGSSTTCVLTAAILEEGMKHLDEAQPMEIMKSLNDCFPLIEKSLKEQRKEIVDKDGNIDFERLKQVATISAESEDIGQMIADIYKKIGKDGIVHWDNSKTGNDYFEIGTGIKMDEAMYASRWMCDDENGGPGLQATMENPYVLLAQSKITTETELEKVFGDLVGQGIKELVIFCDEMEEPVLASLIRSRLPNSQGGVGFRFLVIKMPVVFNDFWWEDLAKASGGRLINKASGIKMKDVGIDFLGKFEKITVTPHEVFIDGIQDLSKHILALKVDGSEQALARAARLNTKTARYYVGAMSDGTLRQKRDKVEDAVNSSWSAMQKGILPGGGAALLNTAVVLDLQSSIGAKILRIAVTKPFVQIVQNAGKDAANTLKELGSLCLKGSDYDGFNSKTGGLTNMMEAGIVDSYDVVLGAVKSAIGVASGILTCGTVVLLPRQEDSITDQIASKVTQMITQK
jgi:chaperonin GroEL